MSRIFTITVAFCPASQLARALLVHEKIRRLIPDRHIVIQGHYPINKKKNNRDIEMICENAEVEFMDPGEDLGSAQSQNWALEKINPSSKDFFINWDPDTNVKDIGWDVAAHKFLVRNPDCVLVSCWSEQWKTFRNRVEIVNNDPLIAKAIAPTPFNLSMFRCGFVKEIGGLKQLGERWGELEAIFYQECIKRNKYHAYTMDHEEDYSGKFMQDRQLLEYKDAYMRTAGPNQFIGSYEEFLKLKYPELLSINTLIPEGTVFE